jgi:hypothetical protein
MYGSQTILESSQAPPPNNCLRSVHCHYRSLYLIYYNDADIDDGFPADIEEAASRAALDLLLSKFRQQYDMAYNRFLEWCKLKKVEDKFSKNVYLF